MTPHIETETWQRAEFFSFGEKRILPDLGENLEEADPFIDIALIGCNSNIIQEWHHHYVGHMLIQKEYDGIQMMQISKVIYINKVDG